jgi:hypothetical protein
VEFFLIDLAIEEIDNNRRLWEYFHRRQVQKPAETREEPGIHTGDTRIIVYENESGDACYDLVSDSRFKAQTHWNTQLVEFLLQLQNLVLSNSNGSMSIYTCHRRNGQIFRGHPNFRGKGPWKDWVWIDWGAGYGKLPSHIWCFVVIEGMEFQGRNGPVFGGIKVGNGVFGVVETAVADENEEMRSELMAPYLKEVQFDDQGTIGNRSFYLADTDAFLDPACVVPDLGGPINRYFVVKPRNQWAGEFVKWIQEDHSQDVMDDLEVHESDDTESVADEPSASATSSDEVEESDQKRQKLP